MRGNWLAIGMSRDDSLQAGEKHHDHEVHTLSRCNRSRRRPDDRRGRVRRLCGDPCACAGPYTCAGPYPCGGPYPCSGPYTCAGPYACAPDRGRRQCLHGR